MVGRKFSWADHRDSGNLSPVAISTFLDSHFYHFLIGTNRVLMVAVIIIIVINSWNIDQYFSSQFVYSAISNHNHDIAMPLVQVKKSLSNTNI